MTPKKWANNTALEMKKLMDNFTKLKMHDAAIATSNKLVSFGLEYGHLYSKSTKNKIFGQKAKKR